MRNRDRSAHDQRYIERIHELCARHAGLSALFDVISDAIVASQNDGSRQTHQLFGFFIEGAIFVSLRIERKKPLDAEMAAAEQLLVHLGPIPIKVVHAEILSAGTYFAFWFAPNLSQCLTGQNLATIGLSLNLNHELTRNEDFVRGCSSFQLQSVGCPSKFGHNREIRGNYTSCLCEIG